MYSNSSCSSDIPRGSPASACQCARDRRRKKTWRFARSWACGRMCGWRQGEWGAGAGVGVWAAQDKMLFQVRGVFSESDDRALKKCYEKWLSGFYYFFPSFEDAVL